MDSYVHFEISILNPFVFRLYRQNLIKFMDHSIIYSFNPEINDYFLLHNGIHISNTKGQRSVKARKSH